MISRAQLNDYYQALLRPETYADYCHNGLQIEGAEHIERIAFAVSATRDSINQAVENKADALVVHHGLFWTFHGAKPLTGAFAQRVFPLVKNNINLIAYHLPLDGHPDIGNAATLGRLIDCNQQQPFGDYKGSATGIKGGLDQPLTAAALQQKLEAVLKHNVILATPDHKALIRSVGIITGGANNEWRLAEKERLDAYITGEISEHDWHESQEAGIHMFAGGHSATEQFGIQALMEKTRQQFVEECFFIDSENPA
ncbi:Nif3-like dinuclear metal center hexameric protein [Methylobacter sp.]|uniref:Nif3-like dinuclear metal center hexameric protein n=1 Tax=Methylobacter sp. TaxID=2051955 RepID=UPI0024872491|nr:Nif3-like dinuclear metal center hexameric protein [Methylobacter sp.]MDI1279137.1 Nif3-like dinuclear metal center hexameric protein [Methylobacter sp.]MDI1359955.1 Nif3-like dinuclear metal center hexameric protein [Methylobacter sp.]